MDSRRNRQNIPQLLPLQAQSVNEFLNFLSRRNTIWQEGKSKENFWVYRGQGEPEKSSPLIPSSLRGGGINQAMREKIFQETANASWPLANISHNIAAGFKQIKLILETKELMDSEISRLAEIIVQSILELKLAEKFIQTCNKSALYLESIKVAIQHTISESPLEITVDNIQSLIHDRVEKWLQECLNMEKLYCVKSYPPLFNYTHYYPLALAQHSGVATRLLDWTGLTPFFRTTLSILNGYLGEYQECIFLKKRRMLNKVIFIAKTHIF